MGITPANKMALLSPCGELDPKIRHGNWALPKDADRRVVGERALYAHRKKLWQRARMTATTYTIILLGLLTVMGFIGLGLILHARRDPEATLTALAVLLATGFLPLSVIGITIGRARGKARRLAAECGDPPPASSAEAESAPAPLVHAKSKMRCQHLADRALAQRNRRICADAARAITTLRLVAVAFIVSGTVIGYGLFSEVLGERPPGGTLIAIAIVMTLVFGVPLLVVFLKMYRQHRVIAEHPPEGAAVPRKPIIPDF